MHDVIAFLFGLIGLGSLVLVVTAAGDWAMRGWQPTKLPAVEDDPAYSFTSMGWWLPDPSPGEAPVPGVTYDRRGHYLLALEEVAAAGNCFELARGAGLFFERRECYRNLGARR